MVWERSPSQATALEGIIAVEEVSTTTPVGENQPFQKACGLYQPNGKTLCSRVARDAVDPQPWLKKEKLSSGRRRNHLPTCLRIRVSATTVKGANVAEQWTGLSLATSFLQVTLTMQIQLLGQ